MGRHARVAAIGLRARVTAVGAVNAATAQLDFLFGVLCVLSFLNERVETKSGRKGRSPHRDHGGIRFFVTSLAKARPKPGQSPAKARSTGPGETEAMELVFLCVFSYEMNIRK